MRRAGIEPAIEVVGIDDQPLRDLRYHSFTRDGGSTVKVLEFYEARAAGRMSRHNVDAIVAMSDLLGVVPDPRTNQPMLVGIAVADLLEDILEELSGNDELPRIGIILAGGFFSPLTAHEKSADFGNVASVWRAFAERFDWVVGVLGGNDGGNAVKVGDRVYLLDTDVVTIDGLRIGGVGLIAGDSAERCKRAEQEQLARIELIANEDVDLLILHEGPNSDAENQQGHHRVRALLENSAVPLTICGQPSPKEASGRPAHRPFRGLLGVHTRCGLPICAVT